MKIQIKISIHKYKFILGFTNKMIKMVHVSQADPLFVSIHTLNIWILFPRDLDFPIVSQGVRQNTYRYNGKCYKILNECR